MRATFWNAKSSSVSRVTDVVLLHKHGSWCRPGLVREAQHEDISAKVVYSDHMQCQKVSGNIVNIEIIYEGVLRPSLRMIYSTDEPATQPPLSMR